MKKAVVLFSGGLDSTTCLAIANEAGFQCHALNFAYGQCHSSEIQAAKEIAKAMSSTYQEFPLAMGILGGSALTDTSIPVPDYQGTSDIPVTYVPARNTIFLSIALGVAEVIGAQDIFIGANAVDYSHYPDCRPAYVDAFQTMANLATKAGVDGGQVRIQAPLMYLSKAEIIKKGQKLGVDYAKTVSCYRLSDHGAACGQCDSCVLRKRGFSEAGIDDPTRYISA